MNNHLDDILCITPLGEFHMFLQKIDDTDVVRAAGFGSPDKLQERLSPELSSLELRKAAQDHPYSSRVQDYFNGHMTALDDIPWMQEGNAFYQRVWHVMNTTVQAGQTLAYKKLAEKIGNTNAVRAVGTACGSNKIILIVPCHRIVRSDGGLGGYVYGEKIKRALLNHEARFEKAI